MGTTFDAKLRLTADTAQAAAAVKGVKDELANVGKTPATSAAPRVLKDVAASAEDTAKQLRQTQRQLALLGPQLTDIVVGLTTGQAPFTVLLQQGGQLRDVFGSFGNVFKALASVFTPIRLLVGGVAAAIGTVAFAAFQGAQESAALSKSLALTGNIAGTSAGQINTLVNELEAAGKASRGAAREAAIAVASSGDFAGATVSTVTRAVLALTKLSGQTTEEALKQFSGLTGSVADGAAKLNKQYGFLTATQFQYIQSLTAQGREQEAIRFVTNELAATLEQRTIPTVGTLEKAWTGVKNILSGVYDQLKAIGRDQTAEERIASLQKRLADAQGFIPGAGRRRSTNDAQTAALQDELNAELRLRAADQKRATDKSIAQQEAQDAIAKSSKAFQDSLAAVDQAGAQRLLAQQIAALDARKSAVERSNANGLLSEKEYSNALGQIEVDRAQAQLAAADKQLGIEEGRTAQTEQEVNARNAAVLNAEGRVIQARAALAKATSDDRTKADTLQLAEARKAAEDYARVWQQAAQLSRQFAQEVTATQAKLVSDPVQRAQAEADAATAAVRKQLADQVRDLTLQIDVSINPNQKAELQRQLEELQKSGDAAIGDRTRSALLKSLQDQAQAIEAELQAREQSIQQRVDAGLTTTADGEREVLALRSQQIPALERILVLMESIAKTPEEQQTVRALKNSVAAATDLRTELEKTARSQGVSGIADALKSIETGAKSGKAALLDMVGGFANAMLDVLNKKLAQALVNQFVGAASSSGGGFFSTAATFVASLFHTGGLVGSGSPATRAVSPLAFAAAPRYHSGNTGDLMSRLGIRAGEHTAVLKDDEEVLTADNPRHVKNFRGLGGVSISNSVTINGASGNEATQRAAIDDLSRSQEVAMNEWAVRQMRPGGMLARG